MYVAHWPEALVYVIYLSDNAIGSHAECAHGHNSLRRSDGRSDDLHPLTSAVPTAAEIGK